MSVPHILELALTPAAAPMWAQVTIDARGLMKVAHLISMSGAGGGAEYAGDSQLGSFAAHAATQVTVPRSLIA